MTPEVDFRPGDALLLIRGESYPENVIAFYAPILECLRTYLQEENAPQLRVDILITYYNSASAKAFHRLMGLFNESCNAGCKVVVNWQHDEEDEMMSELGNDLKDEFNAIDFRVTCVNAA
jgi:hypothetical protein